MPPPRRGRRPAGGLGRTVYALMLLAAFFLYATAGAPVPIAAELRAQVGLDGTDASLFMLPFAAGFAVGCLLWFALGRHAPGRVLLPLSLALVAVASAGLLLAGSPAVAAGARALVGVASAGFPAATQAAIAGAVAPQARGRMIGGFAAAVVVGGVVGQAVVGVLADLTSARIAVAVVCVAAPLAVAAGLRAALRPGDDGSVTGAAPLAVPHLLRAQWSTLAVAALLFGTYWLMLARLAEAVREERFQLSAGETGLLPALGVAGVLSTLAAGWASDRRGPRAPTVATIAAGCVLLAATLAGATPLWLFAAGYGGFIAAYWGFLPPGSSEVAHRAAAPDRQPALMAFYAAAWLGAAAFTALGTALGGWTACAIVTLAAWGLAAVISAATFGPAGPRGEAAAEADAPDRVPSRVGGGPRRPDA